MIDLSKPDEVRAEAERRARLRAEGKPLTGEGGVARLHAVTRAAVTRSDVTDAEHPGNEPVHVTFSRDRTVVRDRLAFDTYVREITIGAPAIAWRGGDVLWLTIPATARSKKNSTMLGIRKSPGYVRFRNQVCAIVTPFAEQLRLPLPDIDYNCAASFYMEREAADTDNLMSGLADALQDAKVLGDDFRIRTWNGTDRFVDALRPRVEIMLTPYLAGHR